jgi:hypothetical protein
MKRKYSGIFISNSDLGGRFTRSMTGFILMMMFASLNTHQMIFPLYSPTQTKPLD